MTFDPCRTQDIEALRSRLNLRHVGKAKGVTAETLAGWLHVSTRGVRKMITELRRMELPVCGHPSTGYFIAETKEELEETCAFLRRRAMHSLTLEAALRKMSLQFLVGQLEFDLREAGARADLKERRQ